MRTLLFIAFAIAMMVAPAYWSGTYRYQLQTYLDSASELGRQVFEVYPAEIYRSAANRIEQ